MAAIYAEHITEYTVGRFTPEATSDQMVVREQFVTGLGTLTTSFRAMPFVRVVLIVAAHMSAPSDPPSVSGAMLDWRLSGTVSLSRDRYAWLYEADVTVTPPESWEVITVDLPVPAKLIGADLWALSNVEMGSGVTVIGLDTFVTVNPNEPSEPFRVRARTFQGAGEDEVPFAPSGGDVFAYLVAFTAEADNLSATPKGFWNVTDDWYGGGIGETKAWDNFAAGTDEVPPHLKAAGSSSIPGMRVGVDVREAGIGGFDVFTPGGIGVVTMRPGPAAEKQRIIHPTTYEHIDPWETWPLSSHYDQPVEWGLFAWGNFEIPHLRQKQRDDIHGRVRGTGNQPTSRQRSGRASNRNSYV